MTLLSIKKLDLWFTTPSGLWGQKPSVRALDGVDLTLAEGETLALVGESGSGKTTLGYAVAGLHQPTKGEILIDGKPIHEHAASPVQLVFQDPFSALNPRMLVADIVAEPLRIRGVSATEYRPLVNDMLGNVGLSAEHGERYPHEFSGGQRQRIAIARAMIARPRLLVADEPLSALDVSIQSQVLNLIKDIRERETFSMLFISHDLAVVNNIADRVAVLYLGRVMEIASREEIFAKPAHPYTRALMASVPRIGTGRRKRGTTLQGEIPSPLRPPSGCAFHTRCPMAQDICRNERPALTAVRGNHAAACHFRDQ